MESLGLVVDRRLLARYVAPVVFLLAVTGVVLVVRAGLRHESAPARPDARASLVVRPVAPKPAKPSAPKRWYVIQSGDTLEAVAARYGTSVAALLKLNPGIDPRALVPGQRVRIR